MLYSLHVSVILLVTAASALSQYVLLNDGNRIPLISFGTVGKVSDIDKNVKQAIIEAIESGYRLIDTAAAYRNEEHIGEAIADVIRRGIVTREELFITTKLNFHTGNREDVVPAIRSDLKKLQLESVDLYLIHFPNNVLSIPVYDYLNIWKGMEDAKSLNLTKSIGVSNFGSTEINRILANSETIPAVNEIEVHPTYTNLDLVAYCQSKNIIVLSYAPFGFLVPRPFITDPPTITFEEPILLQIAQKYGKLSNQVVIRYLIDRGVIPIPRSVNKEHIMSNIDIFNFSLTEKEIYSINELNKNTKVYNFDRRSFVTFTKYLGLFDYLYE